MTARILFDGTHRIDVNARIRIRDSERAPIAADVKRREVKPLKLRRFALTADISEAHRQVIDPRDWHFLGCQVTAGSDVYVHTVGTFGIASASYYSSKVYMAVGRPRTVLGLAQSTATWTPGQTSARGVLCSLCSGRSSPILAQGRPEETLWRRG